MRRFRFVPLFVEFRILRKGWIESDIVQVQGLIFFELYCYLASVCFFFFVRCYDDTYEDSDVYDNVRVDGFVVGTMSVEMLFQRSPKNIYPTRNMSTCFVFHSCCMKVWNTLNP